VLDKGKCLFLTVFEGFFRPRGTFATEVCPKWHINDRRGYFFGKKSMKKSSSFPDVPKVAPGAEKVAILTLGDPKNHPF